MANHDGIRQAKEQEAVLIFELPEVQQTADYVAACFREADLISAQAQNAQREAARKKLEIETERRLAAATTQAEGGRLAHVTANQLTTEAVDLMLQAAARNNESEKKTLQGERAWAELAHKHGLFVPHGRRLEIKSAEHPGMVYCLDVDEGEMGLHQENACPQRPLRHDASGTRMLRRRGARGKLVLWAGRKD